MRVFVAGASGTIGARAVRLLVKAGHQVTGLARTEMAQAQLERLGAQAVRGNVLDEGVVRMALPGHQAVVNLTTRIPSSAEAVSARGWREDDQVRTQGSAVIADAAAAAGIRRLVQEAVTFVYPDQGDEWITEQVPPAPNRKSQSATMTATGNALRFAETGGGVTVVLRFGLLYGPDRNSAELLARVHRGKRAVLGRPGGWLAPLHPDDAAAAVVAALACPGGIYNVCETPVPRSEWAAAVGREAHGEPVDYDVGAPARFYPTFVQRLAGSRVEPLTRSQRVSNAAFVKATGWRTRHDVLQGSWLDEGSAGRTTTDSSPAANS